MDQELFLADFKSTVEGYAPISDKTWQLLKAIVRFQRLEKGEILLRGGQLAKQFHFVCKGALRAFYTDADGNTYNKNIFLERYFAGSKVSLLTGTPSNFTIEALEESFLLNIDYKSYRSLIDENDDLKNFYIAYLERNWVFEKEQREISLVMENATTRYLKLLEKHPDIDKRIPQLHIASHLGITPTQLSRIRKEVKKNR